MLLKIIVVSTIRTAVKPMNPVLVIATKTGREGDYLGMYGLHGSARIGAGVLYTMSN